MRLPNFFEGTQKINSPYDKSLPTEKKSKIVKTATACCCDFVGSILGQAGRLFYTKQNSSSAE